MKAQLCCFFVLFVSFCRWISVFGIKACHMYMPPFTASTCPVMKLARGLARKTMASAISSGAAAVKREVQRLERAMEKMERTD
jgi:hypothetical protein